MATNSREYIDEHEGRSQNPPDLVFEPGNNTYALARRYADQRQHDLNILVAVGTTDRNHGPNLEWMTHLDALKIRYKKILVEGVGHDFAAINSRVGLDVMRFHVESRGRLAAG